MVVCTVKLFKLVLLFYIIAAIACAPFGGGQQRERRAENNGTDFDLDLKVTSPHVAVNWSTVTQNFECFKNTSVLDNVPLCRGFISGVVIGGAVLVLIVFLVAACIGRCVYKKWCKPKHRHVMFVHEVVERINQEETERENARVATNYFLELASTRSSNRSTRIDYKREVDMNDMGSRMQKYWYRARSAGSAGCQEAVITNAPLPRHCSLLKVDEQTGRKTLNEETVSDFNDLMETLREHPFLQPIEKIGYLDDRKQVIIIQPFMPGGSLKDMIYQVLPDQDWADKYPDPRRDSARKESNSQAELIAISDDESSDDEDPDGEVDLNNSQMDYSCCCFRRGGRSTPLAQTSSALCMNSFVADDNDLDQDESQTPQLCCCFRRGGRPYPHYYPVPVSDPDTNNTLIPGCIPTFCSKFISVAGPGPTPILDTDRIPTPLPVNDIAKYGWQILKAMVFLYKQGFPVLGHVQSGNIFVQDGVCRVGGYENTLLGYRSRFYRMCEDHLEHMDVIMFGHLVFEMSCGYELITLFPTDEDYQAVKARDRRIEEVLRYIFADDFPHSIKNIKEKNFFKSAKTPQLIGRKFRVTQFFSRLFPHSNTSKILAAVREGQGDPANKHAKPMQKRDMQSSSSRH